MAGGVRGVSLRRIPPRTRVPIRSCSIAGSPWKGAVKDEFESHVLRASLAVGAASSSSPISWTEARQTLAAGSLRLMPRRTAWRTRSRGSGTTSPSLSAAPGNSDVGHGARPGEQGGRPATSDGDNVVVEGPLRGGSRGRGPSRAAEPARLEALEGLRVAEAASEILLLIPNLAVLGFLGCPWADPPRRMRSCPGPSNSSGRSSVREPAYFRVVPDEVEALMGLGRLDEAEALLAPFEEAGRNHDRAWTMATGSQVPGARARGPG